MFFFIVYFTLIINCNILTPERTLKVLCRVALLEKFISCNFKIISVSSERKGTLDCKLIWFPNINNYDFSFFKLTLESLSNLSTILTYKWGIFVYRNFILS